MTATLRPRHRIVRGRPPQPTGMARVALTTEQRTAIEGLCLGVFADMSNSGAALTDVLTAIYLTGAENALAAMKDRA